VVNLEKTEVAVFRSPNQQGYQTQSAFKEGTIIPLAFLDLEIEVKRLFES
jgi:Uma2 family endonuclease